MHSPRVLGVIALSAIVAAAISFAVVDVTVDESCAAATCVGGIPLLAVGFTILGTLAALGGLVPTITWIVEAARQSHSVEHDRELVRASRLRIGYEDEL